MTQPKLREGTAPGQHSPWFCYLVVCADGTLYAGITTNLERRVAEHNRGTASKYTRARLPVQLVYAEAQPDRGAATRRELQLKALSRDRKQALQEQWRRAREDSAAPPMRGERSGLMEVHTLQIDRRFCGPPGTANGGYVSGRLAAYVPEPVVVRLLAPIPLDEALQVEVASGVARLFHGSTALAATRPADWHLQTPLAPTFAQAQKAAQGYLGFTEHAFPGCFVCGPQRPAGDGLRIFPGPLPGGTAVAAPWVPAETLATRQGAVVTEFLWAALDCTGAFAVLPVPPGRAVLLGEFGVQLQDTVAVGESCVVVGWSLGIEGRKRFAGSALYGEGGRIAAVARATWIEVAAAAFCTHEEG